MICAKIPRKDIAMPIYNARLASLDLAEVRRYAGLAKADFDEGMIEDAAQEALLIIAPKSAYHLYDYDCQQGVIKAAAELPLTGRSIQKHLAGCEKVLAISATIGPDIVEAITRHFEEGRYAHSVLLDAAATEAVEETANALEKMLAPKIKAQGFASRWRFSPGYGDWPLEAQQEFMPLTGAEEIGITLTASMMLSPRKSITALIGLYRPETASSPATSPGCQSCGQKDCPSRRK